MRYRFTAVKALGRRRVLESLIDPGLYLSLTAALASALFLVAAFVRSVDSSGFDYERNGFYRFLAEASAGIFGERLFALLMFQGPMLLAFYAALAPVTLYLMVVSIFRFSAEKRAGLIELLVAGPMDGTSYCLASLARDLLLTLGVLAIVLVFCLIGASVGNLALPSALSRHLLHAYLAAASLYSCGLLVAALTDHASSALALGFLILLAFIASLIGEYAIVDGYVQTIAAVAGGAFGWLSPLHYWALGIRGMATGEGYLVAIAVLGQITLCALLALAASAVLSRRGVRS